MKISANYQRVLDFCNKYNKPAKKAIKNTGKAVGYTTLGLGAVSVGLLALFIPIKMTNKITPKKDPTIQNGKEMMYIKQKAPEKYLQYLENIYKSPEIRQINGSQTEYNYWHKAAKEVAESLRVDSIKNAAKKVPVK